jgi:hyperosmotically inducible protein
MLNLLRRTAVLVIVMAGASQVAIAHSQSPADEKLKDRVEYRLETHPTVRKYDIKVKAVNGTVTLTGEVATEVQKTEAAAGARIDGVTAIDNQLTVDPNADTKLSARAKAGLSKAGDKITDAWITTKVKWFMTSDDLLNGSRIDVDTKNRVVTLKGTVKTEAGRSRAVALAKDTDGVSRVVDLLVIG